MTTSVTRSTATKVIIPVTAATVTGKKQSRFGESEIMIPRDRNGDYEPKIVKKYETTSNQLEEQIIAMYARGMSPRDIEDHIKDIYGVEISPTTVSKGTDKIMPLISEWRSRPLERVYPIVYLDAIHFKVRKDNRIRPTASWALTWKA
jgi:transposase-like protein